MRVTLMHNPTAGDGQHTKEALLQALREAGYVPSYQSTDEEEYPQALEDPGELVVVAGGDGTVDKVARHLVGRALPMGLLPLGTANNIATTLGIVGSPEALIAGWASARRRPFDVGTAEGPWGQVYFIEAMGVGLFPQMMPIVDALPKQRAPAGPEDELEHDLDAFRTLLSEYQAQPWHVTLDGQDLSGRYLLLEAMNIQDLGPSIGLAPEADPGDGHFDVVLARSLKTVPVPLPGAHRTFTHPALHYAPRTAPADPVGRQRRAPRQPAVRR